MIETKIVKLGDDLVVEKSQKYVSCNILEARVATTGLKFLNGGHGSCTSIELKNIACTNMSISFSDGSKEYECRYIDSLKIELEGDTELQTVATALQFLAKQLSAYADDDLIPKDRN